MFQLAGFYCIGALLRAAYMIPICSPVPTLKDGCTVFRINCS